MFFTVRHILYAILCPFFHISHPIFHSLHHQVNKLEIRSKINPLIDELSNEQVREMLLVDAYPLPGVAAIDALRIKANTEVLRRL